MRAQPGHDFVDERLARFALRSFDLCEQRFGLAVIGFKNSGDVHEVLHGEPTVVTTTGITRPLLSPNSPPANAPDP